MRFLSLPGLKIVKAIPIANVPLTRMMPIPPSPGGVDTAHMVSCSGMEAYYHKQGKGEKEIYEKELLSCPVAITILQDRRASLSQLACILNSIYDKI
jgi:hypothetical protein